MPTPASAPCETASKRADGFPGPTTAQLCQRESPGSCEDAPALSLAGASIEALGPPLGTATTPEVWARESPGSCEGAPALSLAGASIEALGPPLATATSAGRKTRSPIM